MLSLGDVGRLRAPALRLGRGAALSVGLHLLGLGALLLSVRRGGAHSDEGRGSETVAVDTVGEAPLVGPPASAVGPSPQAVPRHPAGELPAPRRTGEGVSHPRRVTSRPAAESRPAAVERTGTGGSAPAIADKGTAATPSARALFIAELRKRMHASWRPQEVYARIDPQERLPGSVLTSSLLVRLRPDGKIERTEVAESSGVTALDNEARDTLGRMQALPPLPPEMIDDKGGFSVRCTFSMDAGAFRFGNALHRAIASEWRPSRAFLLQVDRERTTTVKLELSPQGTIVKTSVISSAGIDFLDRGALAALKPGTRLAEPPPAFVRQPRPLFVEFQHHLGDLRVLRPREDMEAEAE
jgi:TonB family protein